MIKMRYLRARYLSYSMLTLYQGYRLRDRLSVLCVSRPPWRSTVSVCLRSMRPLSAPPAYSPMYVLLVYRSLALALTVFD